MLNPRHATQSVPAALITAIRFNQARTTHIQVVTIGATNYSRGPVAATQRLVVKPTSVPVVVARIYIRQWIRSCTKATSGVENQGIQKIRIGKEVKQLQLL